MGTPRGPRAGFWRRFGGLIIDGIILGVIDVVVRVVLKGGAGSILALVVALAYFTLFVGSRRGQTPGMSAQGFALSASTVRLDRLRSRIHTLDSRLSVFHRALPRLLLDAVGQGEAVLARQARL